LASFAFKWWEPGGGFSEGERRGNLPGSGATAAVAAAAV